MGSEEKWLKPKEAEKLAGTSRTMLTRAVDAGFMRRKRNASGYVYSYADCEEYQERKEERIEASRKRRKEAKDPIIDDMSPETPLLQQAYGMIQILVGPAQQFGALLKSENDALRRRCSHLEERHDELITAREQLLDFTAERDIERKHAASADKRKDKALTTLQDNVFPMLVGGLTKGKGGPKQAEAAKAGLEMFRSLDENQIQLLLHTELTTEPQKAKLRTVLGALGVELKELAEEDIVAEGVESNATS